MKQFYLKKLVLALMMLVAGSMAYADEVKEVQIDGICYELDDSAKTALVSKNFQPESFYEGNLVIPQVITYSNTTYKVIGIAENAFRSCENLTSITIPESVTCIGEYNQEIKGMTNVEVIPVSA